MFLGMAFRRSWDVWSLCDFRPHLFGVAEMKSKKGKGGLGMRWVIERGRVSITSVGFSGSIRRQIDRSDFAIAGLHYSCSVHAFVSFVHSFIRLVHLFADSSSYRIRSGRRQAVASVLPGGAKAWIVRTRSSPLNSSLSVSYLRSAKPILFRKSTKPPTGHNSIDWW